MSDRELRMKYCIHLNRSNIGAGTVNSVMAYHEVDSDEELREALEKGVISLNTPGIGRKGLDELARHCKATLPPERKTPMSSIKATITLLEKNGYSVIKN
ncbi:MAG: hypothetical protein C9356_20375 [Oleiphilus sp.]|nr:MAG: hypothetical protein C9356_20375 [Oleiphilus sp.]